MHPPRLSSCELGSPPIARGSDHAVVWHIRADYWPARRCGHWQWCCRAGPVVAADDRVRPLVPKGPELALPREFNYQVISRQRQPMHDGASHSRRLRRHGRVSGSLQQDHPDPQSGDRERLGEVPVVSPMPYEPVRGGTPSVVSREKAGRDADGNSCTSTTVEDSFTILGGTSTNCAGGVMPQKKWITCEEVVKGPASGRAPAVRPHPSTATS